MPEFTRIEHAYTSKDACRLIWSGVDEDDYDVVILNKDELDRLSEIVLKNTTGKVELQDEFSTILVNSDVTQFLLKDNRTLEADTEKLKSKISEYKEIPHEPKPIRVYPKEFYPSIEIKEKNKSVDKNAGKEQTLLQAILRSDAKKQQVVPETDLFRVMSTRRSTRNFDKTKFVEDWKIDKILAAADTAPTAGNFQGFEVFYVKDKKAKEALVEAANNQPYVNSPLVLVFCINPERVKMDFPPEILAKFSLQDATLAAAYSQLAASALGLSSIWIGMIDEEKVKKIINTQLRPSSILCVGYPAKKRPPKSRRKLRDLIHVIDSTYKLEIQ